MSGSGDQQQWLRKAQLVLGSDAGQALDLSKLHFKFQITAADVQSPNNASIRVYNLSESTVKKIKGEFQSVELSAGYINAQYGLIFSGQIMQFRTGKENQTDTYLDILAADGDEGYSFGVISQTFAAGSEAPERFAAGVAAMGLNLHQDALGTLSGLNPQALTRGKVGWGMARDFLRSEATAAGATWSTQNGRVQVVPTNGYLPGQALVVNAANGMIGIPEATDAGVKVSILLNPNVVVGGLLHIDNNSINQLAQQNPVLAPIAYNSRTGFVFVASTSDDGYYRVYVAEHEGDTRGTPWYTTITCLLVDYSSQTVVTAPD